MECLNSEKVKEHRSRGKNAVLFLFSGDQPNSVLALRTQGQALVTFCHFHIQLNLFGQGKGSKDRKNFFKKKERKKKKAAP